MDSNELGAKSGRQATRSSLPAKNERMNCPKCGAEAREAVRFCQGCANAVYGAIRWYCPARFPAHERSSRSELEIDELLDGAQVSPCEDAAVDEQSWGAVDVERYAVRVIGFDGLLCFRQRQARLK